MEHTVHTSHRLRQPIAIEQMGFHTFDIESAQRINVRSLPHQTADAVSMVHQRAGQMPTNEACRASNQHGGHNKFADGVRSEA